ncbi:MAG: hypothetical protein Q4E16_06960 [Neisseria sp.]|nr:hypothetical protein [Neisseria sp.]
MKTAILSSLAVCTLAACATSPEWQARRAAEQQRYEQQLQVALAAQCDLPTAELMRRQFANEIGQTQKEQQDFRVQYVEKVGDKMFQACYRMAWQNYTAQRRLEDLRWRDYDDFWYGNSRVWRYW